MRGSRNFCQFYLVLILFYSFQRGSNGFIAEKTILILYQGSRGGLLYSGRCPTFSGGGGGGPNANFYRIHIRTCCFPGGVPNPPLDPHMGNVIVTGQYLSQFGF